MEILGLTFSLVVLFVFLKLMLFSADSLSIVAASLQEPKEQQEELCKMRERQAYNSKALKAYVAFAVTILPANIFAEHHKVVALSFLVLAVICIVILVVFAVKGILVGFRNNTAKQIEG